MVQSYNFFFIRKTIYILFVVFHLLFFMSQCLHKRSETKKTAADILIQATETISFTITNILTNFY